MNTMDGTSLSPNVLWVVGATFAALATGTVVRLLVLREAPGDVAKNRLDSLKTWWLIVIVVVAALLLGRVTTSIVFAFISAAALREFARLSESELMIPSLWTWAFLLIPLNYLWILFHWPLVFIAFLPLAGIVLLSSVSVWGGNTEGFIRRVSTIYWGTMVTVYFLAHAVLLLTLPPSGNPSAGVIGWFIFLILLTESNDIAQALVGRRIGKWRITPRVSPNKTLEGLVGGILTTTILAVVLAPWLTHFDHIEAAIAGILVSLGGFLGDLNMSAVKRDVGVKDASLMLPGQGGVLDRIDSLTFTAPIFYYFILLCDNRERLSAG